MYPLARMVSSGKAGLPISGMRFLISIWLVACSLFSAGQLVVDSCPGMVTVVDPGTVFYPSIFFSNQNSYAVDAVWERELNDLPAEWFTAIADVNIDYAPFADEPLGPTGDLIPIPINPGAQIGSSGPTGPGGYTIRLLFFTNGLPGSGTVRLCLYDLNNPSDRTCCEVTVTAEFTPTSTSDPTASEFAIYPNPASDFVQVNTEQPGISTLRDAEGRTLISSSETLLELHRIPSGLYFLDWISQDGSLRQSRPLIISK